MPECALYLILYGLRPKGFIFLCDSVPISVLPCAVDSLLLSGHSFYVRKAGAGSAGKRLPHGRAVLQRTPALSV